MCYGSYDPYDLHAWLTRIVNISYKSHKGKQAGSNNNIPRFISHKSKQARFNCHIPCSISRIPKQARFKCNTQWSCSGACLRGNNTMWNWKGGRFVTIQYKCLENPVWNKLMELAFFLNSIPVFGLQSSILFLVCNIFFSDVKRFSSFLSVL